MSRGAPIHPRQRRAAAAARGPARLHLGPGPDLAPDPPWPGASRDPGRGGPFVDTGQELEPHALPYSSSVHRPRLEGARSQDPPPSTLHTWARGVSGACPSESHLRCPQRGGRGRAGRGRDWSAAEPRPRPPPESDPTFSPARAPPPAPRSLLALSPPAAPLLRVSGSHPPERQPRAPDPRPGYVQPRDQPRPPRSPPGKMRLLPEWLLLLFGPWLLKKVRAAGLQREPQGPGRKGPRVRGAP